MKILLRPILFFLAIIAAIALGIWNIMQNEKENSLKEKEDDN